MFFVVLLHYTAPLDAVDAIRPAHIEHIERYAREGVFHAWARRDPPTGSARGGSARPRSAGLDRGRGPLREGGVARAEIVSFNPANVRGMLRT